MAPETVASGSPDSTHLRAENGSAIAVIRGETTRGWVTNALLALSIFTLAFVGFEYHDVRKAEWLNEYENSVTKSELVAPLQAAVKAQQSELTALQVRLAVRDECKR